MAHHGRPRWLGALVLLALFMGSMLTAGCSKSDPVKDAPVIKERSLPPGPPK